LVFLLYEVQCYLAREVYFLAFPLLTKAHTIPIPQKLCVVDGTFTITGHGFIAMTKEWQAGQNVSLGGWIELRSPTGQRRLAQVKSVESVRRSTEGNTIGLRLVGVPRETIHAGDEIWSVDTAD